MVVPAARAGRMTSLTSWRRAALNRRASVSGSVAAVDVVRASRTSRRRSPSHVPPGSRVTWTSRPRLARCGREGRRLGRLAGSVWPFDGDEPAAWLGSGKRHAASVADDHPCDPRSSVTAPSAYPFGRHGPSTAGGSAPQPLKICRMTRDATTMTMLARRSRRPRRAASRPRRARPVLLLPAVAARAPARQLHDQPLRRDPGRARADPARRRHRPGRDPDLPGTPRLRHGWRWRGLR